ncbi:MAG: acylneuraminate cytidylyltransferase, partial [Promethearchaeota archaeon]
TTSEKEHVTSYIRSNPDLFKITNVEAPRELYEPKIRITLDTEEDYALLCVVYDYLYPIDSFFSTKDIIDLFKDKPWLKLINKKVVQKKKFNSLEEEIEEAIRVLSLQDLNKAKDYLKSRFK